MRRSSCSRANGAERRGPAPPGSSSGIWPLAGLGDRSVHQLLELAVLEQLQSDVAAAHQLATDEHLRKGGPVGIARQIAVHFRVFKDVHVGEVAAGGQRLRCATEKTAQQKIGSAFHEDHHRIFNNQQKKKKQKNQQNQPQKKKKKPNTAAS